MPIAPPSDTSLTGKIIIALLSLFLIGSPAVAGYYFAQQADTKEQFLQDKLALVHKATLSQKKASTKTSADIKKLKKITDQILTHFIPWSQVFTHIANITPENIVINNFSATYAIPDAKPKKTPPKNTISLQGKADDYKHIASFIETLESSPLFKNVKFSSSTKKINIDGSSNTTLNLNMELEQTIGLDQVVDSSPVTDQQTIPNNISFNPDHPDNKIASLTERLDPPPPTGLVKNTEQTSITSPTSAKLVINWDQATIPTTDDKSTTTDPIKFYILYSSLTPDTKLENKNIIDHYLALPGHKQGRAVIPVTDSRQTQYLSLVAVDIHGRHSVPSTELVVRAADDTKPAPIVIKKITRKTLNDLTEKVTISWQASPDSDIYAYHIYTGNSPLNLKLRESRTTKPHFKPPPFSFIQKLSPAAIYVRIVAEDTSGNLSLSPVSNE